MMPRHVEVRLNWPLGEMPERQIAVKMLMQVDLMNYQNYVERRCVIRQVWFKKKGN